MREEKDVAASRDSGRASSREERVVEAKRGRERRTVHAERRTQIDHLDDEEQADMFCFSSPYAKKECERRRRDKRKEREGERGFRRRGTFVDANEDRFTLFTMKYPRKREYYKREEEDRF